MSISIGIVGLPNVGKSTLFNALLKKQQALAANYPFATIEPNVGIVPVPDARLQLLAETVAAGRTHAPTTPNPSFGRRGKETEPVRFSPDVGNEEFRATRLPPIVPATVTFTDIAGLVKGASEGEGLGNAFLGHIRETSAIALVVRAFEDADVVMTGSGVAADDVETVMTELILADMVTVDKQIQPKGAVTPEQKKRWEVIERVQKALNEGKRADAEVTEDERQLVSDLFLLTMKPVLYAVNVGESQLIGESVNQLILNYAEQLKIASEDVVIICGKVEADLMDMGLEDQREYLQSLGFEQSGLERLIAASYTKLGLQSFLTAGEKEVRAWTLRAGSTALTASAVIHTDFAKKFIKADVIDWREFVRLGGWKKAREAGAVSSEGRNYIVRDGDVIEFRIGS